MKKPKVKLVGQDGNVFNLLGICSRALRSKKMYDEDSQMKKQVFASSSYDDALSIMMEYCDVN